MVLPFERTFDGARSKDAIVAGLLAELPAIHAWALGGAVELLRRGAFEEPASSVEAKGVWRASADQVSQFVSACCKTGEGYAEASEEVGKLYQSYTEWAAVTGHRQPVTETKFGRRMEQLGYRRDKVDGKRHRFGLALMVRAAWDAPPPPPEHWRTTLGRRGLS